MIENLIRNNPDAVLICDKENLKFLEVNEIAINLYGYRRDEFLQMDLTDLYFTEDIQLLLDSSSANIREGSINGPYKHKKKDGSVILVEMSRFSVKFQDREAHFNLVRNVTAKLEAEKRNLSFKTAFNNTDDLVFITDSTGFIQFINKSITKTLGYTKNDLINSSFVSIVAEEHRSSVNNLIFHSDKKETSTLPLNLKTNDDRVFPADVIISPILGFNKEIESFTLIGKIKQLVITSDDKSQSTQDNSELKESSKENLDSKFLSGLFHEILTPINVIIGFAQELIDNVTGPAADQKEASIIIKQNRSNLLQLMNAAIDYVSLSEKRDNFLPVELKITDVIDLLSKDLDELKDFLEVEIAYGKISSSLKFETDRQRFKDFLSLLLKIILKLTGQKKIFLSAYAHDKEYFLVTFRDLQTHCSKSLVDRLQNIFQNEEIVYGKGYEGLTIFLLLAQKLFKILKAKFVIISNDEDNDDYGILFPISYSKVQIEEIPLREIVQKVDIDKEKTNKRSSSEKSEVVKTETSQPDLNEKLKTKLNEAEELAEQLQNELRLEALREKIRKREAKKKSKKIEEENDEIVDDSKMDELIKDTIEYFDLDLDENLHDQKEEEEIEIIETSTPKVKPAQPAKVKNPDDKIDISNLSCLYIEDQIDSQVLFSVQMKGLNNINFSVSFEECLPLLESGSYDFIVIDMNLQGSYNGLDILRILRSMPRYENTPVFAVTAYVLPGDGQKFILAGFSGFISKPIFRDQMIELLAEVFKESKES